MRLGYVSFLDPYVHNGGGEMLMRDVLDYGIGRGHSIDFYTVLGRKADTAKFLAENELFLLADLYNCYTHPRFYPRKLLRTIIYDRLFIHFDNAYVDVCNLNYLPCKGEKPQDSCTFKNRAEYKRIMATTYKFGVKNALKDVKGCFCDNTIDLYSRSLCNIFVSPLHKKTIARLLDIEMEDRCFVLRPVADTEAFFNMGIERDIDYLFVGAITKAKGIDNIMKLIPSTSITLIGKIVEEKYRGYGNWIEYIEHKELPKYYNRAKNFIFLPEWPEPLGRVVVEAALCGCNLVLNDSVGAASFGFDLADPKNYKDSLQEFWARIESMA